MEQHERHAMTDSADDRFELVLTWRVTLTERRFWGGQVQSQSVGEGFGATPLGAKQDLEVQMVAQMEEDDRRLRELRNAIEAMRLS
jgi:hypothetical protein